MLQQAGHIIWAFVEQKDLGSRVSVNHEGLLDYDSGCFSPDKRQEYVSLSFQRQQKSNRQYPGIRSFLFKGLNELFTDSDDFIDKPFLFTVDSPLYIARHPWIKSFIDQQHFFRSDFNIHVDFFVVGPQKLECQHQRVSVRKAYITRIKNKIGYQDLSGLLGLLKFFYQQLQRIQKRQPIAAAGDLSEKFPQDFKYLFGMGRKPGYMFFKKGSLKIALAVKTTF